MANNYDNKKFDKKDKKPRPNNLMNLQLVLENDLDDGVYNEILNVLAATPFNKISFPISIRRSLIDETVDAEDKRVVTAGYIRKYDQKTNKFMVALFGPNRDKIMALKNTIAVVDVNFYKGELGTITKILIDVGAAEEPIEVEVEAAPETAEENTEPTE